MAQTEQKAYRRAAHLGYAEVALDRPLGRTFTYGLSEAFSAQVRLGSLVEVPLRGGTAKGVIVGITDRVDFKGRVRPILQVLTADYAINEEVRSLARWIADYYFCDLGEALAAVSFIGLNDVHARLKTLLALDSPGYWQSEKRDEGPDGSRVTPKQRSVVDALISGTNQPIAPAELASLAGVGDGVLRTLLKRGWLIRVEEPVVREDEYAGPEAGDPSRPEPTEHQQAALDAIAAPLEAGRFEAFVLKGVTGSGKTEVYLRVIEDALRRGRTALVLVPEIALTPQTVASFRARLGSLAGVYHSRQSLGQKYDLLRKIEAGTVRVVIGARSAVFAPLPDLGVIVVDEEHETSYKQNDAPRYHARDVAVWRAAKNNAIVILGSATPSMESLHNAREGKYTLLEMPKRIGPHASAVMTVVDMKRHIAEGDGTEGSAMISPLLREAIDKRLAAGEQTVLLLNRRGFANQVLCLACEKQRQCPHCDVCLTYHKAGGRLVCHWCGHVERMSERCPHCGKDEVKTLGLGTQRIEEVLGEMFASARVARVDVDTMRGRRSFIDVWDRIRRGEVDIILGTQMIAKGFHLESVTLVGVISADFALFMPDFRSAERTYNLLTQVAGRAGRGDRPGEVIVQSFIPHHYAIDLAARLEEQTFYQKELHIRRVLRFPPIARLIAIGFSGPEEPVVREQAVRLGNMLRSLTLAPHFGSLNVLGPAPAPIARIDDKYRWRLLLRGTAPRLLHDLVRQGLKAFEPHHNKAKVQLTIDVDPVDLL